MTFRTTAYLEGKPVRGQEHAGESEIWQKGGMPKVRKFCTQGETGTVEPGFPRDETHIHHTLHEMMMLESHVDDPGVVIG